MRTRIIVGCALVFALLIAGAIGTRDRPRESAVPPGAGQETSREAAYAPAFEGDHVNAPGEQSPGSGPRRGPPPPIVLPPSPRPTPDTDLIERHPQSRPVDWEDEEPVCGVLEYIQSGRRCHLVIPL